MDRAAKYACPWFSFDPKRGRVMEDVLRRCVFELQETRGMHDPAVDALLEEIARLTALRGSLMGTRALVRRLEDYRARRLGWDHPEVHRMTRWLLALRPSAQ